MLSPNEVYVSCDIEADGPIPGPNSMLSLGATAFDHEGGYLSTFQRNVCPLEYAHPHPNTVVWWSKHPDAYAAATKDPLGASDVMHEFVRWVQSISGQKRSVFCAFPAGYDFMWVYWYLMRFIGKSPFSHSALDIKTLAMVGMDSGYREAIKRNMPRHWFSSQNKHKHESAADSLEQGDLMFNIVKAIGSTNATA